MLWLQVYGLLAKYRLYFHYHLARTSNLTRSPHMIEALCLCGQHVIFENDI